MAGSKIEAVIELTLFLYMTWLSSMLAPFTADFSQYGGKDMPVVLGYILLSANDPQMERALTFPVAPGTLPGVAFIVLVKLQAHL